QRLPGRNSPPGTPRQRLPVRNALQRLPGRNSPPGTPRQCLPGRNSPPGTPRQRKGGGFGAACALTAPAKGRKKNQAS
ncbi:MAG: hypothetical protein LBQ12_08275, partial [Deltaproteobacteria bacterium]|nr:hypothetical protein [Deltaproteobacteria bacterium]